MEEDNSVMSPQQAAKFFKNLAFGSEVKKFLQKGGSRIKPLDADGFCTCLNAMSNGNDKIDVLKELWQFRTSNIVGSEQEKILEAFTFSSEK